MGRIHNSTKRINSDVKSLRLSDTTEKIDLRELQQLSDTQAIHIKKNGVARKAKDSHQSSNRSLNAGKLFEYNPPPVANKRSTYSTYSTRSKKALHRPLAKQSLGNAMTLDLSKAYPTSRPTHALKDELSQLS